MVAVWISEVGAILAIFNIKKRLSLCIIHEATFHEGVCGSGGIPPPFSPRHQSDISGKLHELITPSPGESPPARFFEICNFLKQVF
jgi:hypothetical protein